MPGRGGDETGSMVPAPALFFRVETSLPCIPNFFEIICCAHLYPNCCLFPNHTLTAFYHIDSLRFAVIKRFSHAQSRKTFTKIFFADSFENTEIF